MRWWKSWSGSRTLEAVERDSNLRRVLMEQAVEAAKGLGVGNVWEGGSFENVTQTTDDSDDRDKNPTVNVAVFPSGISSSNDPVMRLAYESLRISNNSADGINGWKIVLVKSKKNAIRKLSRMSINNMILFSHGGYGTNSKISFGDDAIWEPSALEGFQAVRARRIVLFACFIANPDLKIGMSNTPYLMGRSIMKQLVMLTNATVFGNHGYSYPDRQMWNNPGTINFVVAGVDLTWEYRDPNKYVIDGAGIWSSVSPGGSWQTTNALYLNNNGSYGVLNNSWRLEPTVSAMLSAAMQSADRDMYAVPNPGNNAIQGYARFSSGDGGDIVPQGGGTIQ